MKTFAIHTLGCKVNTYESEAIVRLFEAHDYHKISFKEVADVYVINTCTVTNTGDSKSRQIIRRAIRKNPEAVVCVVGCYAQVAPGDIEAIEGVDIILGTQFRHQIVDLVEDHIKSKQRITKISDVMKEKEFEELDVDVFTENTRAFLKIQDGCNNFCTYCIIPYARGLVRSRKPESVLKQAQTLVDHGFVEIVLTGIHTGAYGIDLDHYRFYDLLVDLVEKTKGLKRLRISSIEINQITEEVIDLIKNNPIIVDHLHVPLQSGSDGVLKRMRRKYTCAQYLEKIEQIRSVLPDIALTTDVIVGFPQETQEEFDETYAFIKQIGYSELHVFPYSKRRNTPAAVMDGQVDETVKNERVKALIDLSKQLHVNYAKRFIDKTVDVIFEEAFDEDRLIGHAGNYLKVIAKADPKWIGQVVPVTIKEVSVLGITGEVLEGEGL